MPAEDPHAPPLERRSARGSASRHRRVRRLDSTRSLLSTRSNPPQVSLFLKNYGGIIIIFLSFRIYHFTLIIKCHKCAVAASFVTRLLQQPFNSVHLKDWTWHSSGQYCTPVDSLALLCTRSALRSLFCLERVNVDFHDPPQRQRLVNSIRVLFCTSVLMHTSFAGSFALLAYCYKNQLSSCRQRNLGQALDSNLFTVHILYLHTRTSTRTLQYRAVFRSIAFHSINVTCLVFRCSLNFH